MKFINAGIIRRMYLGVLLVFSVCRFSFAAETTPFDGMVGWYSRFSIDEAEDIAAEGAQFAVCYHGGVYYADITAWLDKAYSNGLKVVVSFPGGYVSDQRVDYIRSYVNHFDSHPATAGWYVTDEPSLSDLEDCTVAYNAIKLESSKPVCIAFYSINGVTSAFADACDIVLYDIYPQKVNHAECLTLHDNGQWAGFPQMVDNAVEEIEKIGKPWILIAQGFGSNPSYSWSSAFRLPTAREAKFMTQYAFRKKASAVVFWAHYICAGADALSTEAYPYNGATWLQDVYTPLASEMATLGPAIGAGKIKFGVLDNQWQVDSEIYQHPTTGEYFVRVMNMMDSSITARVSPLIDGYGYVEQMFVDNPPTVELVQYETAHPGNLGFGVTLTNFEIKWYKLVQ